MSKKLGRGFWWLWIIANIVGSVVLPSMVWQTPYELRSRIILNEILQSIGIALAQTVVLRNYFVKEVWWLALTLMGWLGSLIFIFFVPFLSISSPQTPLVTILAIDFAIIGTVVGICQWQLLKPFRAAGLWLFVSPIALSLSSLGLYTGYTLQSTVLATALQGLIYGAVTGVIIIRILKSPKLSPKVAKGIAKLGR